MRHNIVSLKLKYNHSTTEYRSIFRGTYRGAKSVVPRNTTLYLAVRGLVLDSWPQPHFFLTCTVLKGHWLCLF